MNVDYHIPVPFLWPTEEELVYANEKLLPVAIDSAEKLFEKLGPKFDKTYIDQELVNNWGTGQRMKEHISELGLVFKQFSVFVGAPGTRLAKPHVDGFGLGHAMVARLNVPLRGIKGSKLSWWKTGAEDPRILERHFEEWNARTQQWQRGFSYLADPDAEWEDPDWSIDEPGPCWNRTEKAHRLDLDNTTEIRINITAELSQPVPWTALVEKLKAKGHC
jgi:hypothetical protein